MSELLEGHNWNLEGWDGMSKWLAVSCGALDIGDVLSIGPGGHFVYEDDDGTEIVPNAQLQKLHDDVVWLRLSTTFMGVPLLADLSSDGLELDKWRDGDLFDDCTDRFIVSANFQMLADACVSWFRDRQGLGIDELGCHHDRARSLRT
jgi:hypothetical protein